MGNKFKRLIMFLIIVLGMGLFASEEKKAPNEIIKDNPEREVTTVESMKVRDHATMSLSVTKKNEKVIEGELIGDKLKVQLPVKGISENTLDRMAKPKDGKKLVVESMSKISPRMANKSIKRMPTQEEMNSLTVEQIQAMMNDTTDKKEESTQNKTIKNHIAVENDEGIDVEILDVNKDEDIYVNVEENGQVVDRYRVAIQVANSNPRNGGTISGYNTNEVVPLTAEKIYMSQTERTLKLNKNSPLKNIRDIVYNGSALTKLVFRDDFFSTERVIEVLPESSKYSAGTSFKVVSTQTGNDARNISPIIKSGIGSKGQTEFIQDGGQTGSNYEEYAGEGKIYHGFINQTDYAVSFRKATMIDKNTSNTETNFSGIITEVGFELDPQVKTKTEYPGQYIFTGTVSANYKPSWGSGTTFYANNIKVDIGDQKRTHGEKIDDTKIMTYTRQGLKVNTTWTEIPIQEAKISFMKKNDPDLGLFLQIDGEAEYTKIERASTDEDKNYYTKTYVQTANGKTINQELQLKVFQNDEQWAKVKYRLKEYGGIKNPDDSTTKPEFVFYIIQGRKLSNGKISEMRRVKYILKFNRVVEINPKVNIDIELDPRIKNLIKNDVSGSYSWITLDERFGKWNNNKTPSEEIIYVNQVYNDNNVSVSSVESVEGKETKTTSDGYEQFKTTNSPRNEIAVKQNVTFTQLSQNSNLMLKPEADTYKIIYNGNDSKKYSSTITVTRIDEPKNDSNYDTDKGFIGSGSINLTSRNVGTEYTLINSANGNPVGNELSIQSHTGYLPNFRGFVTNQTGSQIVSKYKVNNSDFIDIGDSNSGFTIDGVLQVRLIKPASLDIKKMIKIKKLKEITYTTPKTITIEYFHDSGMKLGEYTLTVENEVVEKDLGTANVKLDARIAQVDGKYSWIRLSDKRLSKLTEIKSIGNYPEFIGDIEGFSNANTLSQYDNLDITNVESINDSSTLSGPTGLDNVNYKYINGNNEAAIPYSKDNNKITFGQFKEIGANSKLLISKWNFSNNTHDGNNKFKVVASNGIRFVGNIVEKYITQNDLNGISNMAGKSAKDTVYQGTGTLNLARAVIGHEYVFTAGTTNNITVSSPGYTNRAVTLEITSGKSLDATGVLTNNNSGSIANRMIIKEGTKKLADVKGQARSELSESLSDLGVKIGINSNGELVVTKEKDVNIKSKTLIIDYYHIKNQSQDVPDLENNKVNENIHLGRFNLTLENYVIGDYDLNKMTVKIDKRFTSIVTYNWLFREGKVARTVDGQSVDKENYFSDFFKYDGNLQTTTGTIVTNLEMPERSLDHSGVYYGYYHLLNSGDWKGEGAVPKQGNMNDINNLVTASKGNSDDNNSLHNKFSLVFTENGIEKIYRGNIEEKIVGEDAKIGRGSLDTFEMIKDTKYKFKPSIENGNIQSSDSSLVITNATNPVNTKGVIDGTTNKNVANKIKVTFENTEMYSSDENNLSVESDGLRVAINTTDSNDFLGGLILTKIAESITVTNVKVEYFYDINSNNTVSSDAIKLGEFTLTINDVNPITKLGKLTTTIDPRLLNLKNGSGTNVADKEWLTLDKYTGTNLDNGLNLNEYIGLIKDEVDGSLNPNTTFTKILKVSKKDDDYSIIGGGSPNYTRFGKGDLPYVAIKLVNNGSLSTADLKTNKNFARKVSDIGEVTVEVEDGNSKKYSFIHDLAKVTEPTGDSYDSEKGYIGEGTVNLSNIPVSKEFYTLVPQGTTAQDMQIPLDSSTGTLPNLTGLVTGYTNQSIASYYTVTIGSGNVTEGTKINLNAETDIVANQVKIRLKDTGELELLKLTDETIQSTTVTIRYYHSSGIQLGEYVLTISNDTNAPSNGTITTKVDPRFMQITPDKNGYKSYWLTTGNITGSNLTNNILTINMDGIIKTSSTATSSVINKVIEVKNSSNGVYEKVSREVNDYTKYYIGNEISGQNFAVKLGNDISVGGTIARKYSDNTNGDLTIKYVDGSAKKSFVHKFELITSPGTNFTSEAGYSGEGTVDLYGKGANTYTLVMPSTGARATTTTEELVLEDGAKGHLPVLTGLIETNKILATHYKVTINNGAPEQIKAITEKSVLETDKLELQFDTTNMKTQLVKIGNGNITINSVKIEYYYYSKGNTSNEAIKLGEFNLTIEDKKPIDSGDITFTIDPRLRQITSITDSNVTWLTPSGMYGPWNSASKGSYTGFLHLNNGVTRTESTNIERVEDREDGVASGEYTVFRNKKQSSYNDIAFKSNLALNAYGTSDNIMVSPYEDEKFDAIFIDDDGNRYQVNIEVQGHTGVVDQDGYNGSGTLDMSAGKLNTVYEFSAPTSNSDDIQDSTDTLTMTDISQFPNVMGVVEDQTGTVLANEIEVKVGKGTPITGSQENTATAIGNKKYVVNNDLEIELTTDNKLMIKKLKDEFNYTASGQEIIITYKHTKNGFNDITLGKFTLKVKSDITDLGIYTLTVDGRMLADDGKAGYWILTNGTMSGYANSKPGNTNYSQMFSKKEFSDSIFSSSTTIGENDIWVPERPVSGATGWLNDKRERIAFATWDFPNSVVNSLPLGSLNEFQDKLVVNSRNETSYKRNPYTFIFIADGKKYRGTVELARDDKFAKITGTATLDLTGIPKNTSDTWASLASDSGTDRKMNLQFTDTGKLFQMGSFGGTQITNKFTYSVDNRDITVTTSTDGVLGKEIDLNGNSTPDIKIEFITEGLKITKLTNEVIDKAITITPKYNDIVLGVLNLTVTNTATPLGDITVEVDRRLAGITANWVGVDGKLYNSTGMYGEYSGLVGASDTIDLQAMLGAQEVIDIESINNSTNLNEQAGTRATYKYFTDGNNEMALPFSKENQKVTLGQYDVKATNPLVVISKKDIATVTRTVVTTPFALIARRVGTTTTDTLYTGNIIERYVGTGAYSGSGTIDLANSESGSTYTFGTSKTNNTVTGTGSNNGGNLTINITDGDPVNTLGLVGDKAGKNIANKLEVKFKNYNSDTVAHKDTIIISDTTSSIEYSNLAIGIDTATGGLTLKRDGSSRVREVEVNYYYTPTNGAQEILLGTFTLTIKNVLELGDVTVDVDSRLLQIADNTSWIRLGSGKVSNLKGDVSAGEYPLFIKPSEAFNLGSNTIFNDYTVSSITKINGITSINSIGDSESITYYYTNNNGAKNEAAYPINIPLSTFIKTDTNSKLVISKYSYGDTAHTEENDFIATAQKDTKVINIKGNILETYNTPAIKDSGYTGTGSINLVRATLGTAYTFAPGLTQTTTVSGITLNVDNGGRSVNAKGLVKNTNESIANLMEITVNGATSAIRVTGTAGQAFEKTGIKVGDAEITLGITAEGGFKIAKTKEGNINNIPVKIDYYFSPDPSATTPKKVKLGTFTLIINNPVIDGGTAEVEIDERFARFERYNWLFRNNGIGQTANDMTTNNITKYNYFTDFFKYTKDLEVNRATGTITEALRVEGREHRGQYPDKPYVSFNIESTGWKGEAAVPKSGEITNINELMVVSKGNVSLEDQTSLNNKFALLFNDNNVTKIYTGNILEKIVKTGEYYTGSGKLNILNTNKNDEYNFGLELVDNNIASNDTKVSITSATGKPVNTLGVVEGTKDKVVANRIQVTFKDKDGNELAKKLNNSTELSVSYGGLTIGITTTGDTNKGGLSLTRTQEKAEAINIKKVFIEYFYDATPEDETINTNNTNGDAIKLGEFTLEIEKPEFEIIGNNILDFGTMIKGYPTTVSNYFKIKNPSNKQVEFSVAQDGIMTFEGKHLNNENHNITNIPKEEQLEVKNISVRKFNDYIFHLIATADPKENNKEGDYEGEIQVTVTITNP